MSSEKKRATYPKELRAEAKAAGLGLVTVSVLTEDGITTEYQTMADVQQCRFARWAGAIVANRDELGIDLEAVVQSRLETLKENEPDTQD